MASIPFDQRDGVIWFNGEFVPWKDAKVHVLTHGLHYASCVFEGERAYNGRIFELEAHTARLFESANILGFEIPYTQAAINEACQEELRRQGEVVALTDREKQMMRIFASTPGETVPRDALLGDAGSAGERTVDVQINRLRRKIEDDPANPLYLQTVRGVGYRLVTEA